MKILIALFVLAVLGVTAGAVLAADRGAMYSSQTAVAQANTEGIVAQAVSQSQIAGYEASVDLAGITAQLEIARLQFETTRLATLIESEKIQAALAQTNAMLTQSAVDLEKAKLERTRMWMMLVIPALATIVIVVIAMAVMVVYLRRPAVVPNYPRVITAYAPTREIVTVPVRPGVIVATLVGTKQKADYYEVRR